MKTCKKLFAALYGIALLLAGCDPTEYLAWSPDGQYALVRGGDGLRLIDASGKIAGVIDGDFAEGPLPAWMPDSRRIVQEQMVTASSWDAFAELLGAERAVQVKRSAAALTNLVNDYRGDWKGFGETEAFKEWFQATVNANADVNAVVFYLKSAAPELLDRLLKATQSKEDESAANVTRLAGAVYELHLRTVVPLKPSSDRLLARSPDPIHSHGVAPGGNVIAYAVQEPNRSVLYLVAANGNSRPALVEAGVTQADWSPDGQDLFYARTAASTDALRENMQLGTIARRRVCSPSGQLLAKFDAGTNLADVFIGTQAETRVTVLSENRLLFATAEVKLPSVSSAMPTTPALFTLTLGQTPAIEPAAPPDLAALLPNRVDRFVVSPDHKQVAVPGDKGEVALLDLVTRRVRPLQGEIDLYNGNNAPSPMLPAWRGTDELCYVVPSGQAADSSNRCEVALVSIISTNSVKRILSQSWPRSMTGRFLQK